MISFLKVSALLSVTLLINSTGLATETFSVQEWKASFAKAASRNDSVKMKQLTNFTTLEKIAIPKCVDCASKTKMQQARQLFDKNNLTAAENIYNSIPKNSDHWLEAVEERGWTHFRRDDFEKAIAQTKTLLSPQFSSIVSSEAYFLQSLSQLKICDYEGVLKTHQIFKEKQRARIAEMKTLAANGMNDSLKESIKAITHFPLKFEDFGEKLTGLPQLAYRDIEFQKQILKIVVAQAALEVLSKTNQPQLYAKLEKIRITSSSKLKNRVQALAKIETEKNARTVQKLNLVEIEAIQRIHTDSKLTEDMYQKNKFKKTNSDQLVFMDDGQPWMDELDKYDVAATACVKNIRRKM